MLMRIAVVLAAVLVGCGGTHASVLEAPADAGLAAASEAGAVEDASAATDEGGACGAGIDAGAGVVVTDRGPVTGTQASSSAAWAYLGIPYAAPPVGALRWSSPEAHACWSAPLACK
jgi:hypothetical protein